MSSKQFSRYANSETGSVVAWILCGALIAVGWYVMSHSVRMGLNEVHDYVQSYGGSMESGTYLTLLTAAMNNFRVMGAMLIGVGSAGGLLRLYTLWKR